MIRLDVPSEPSSVRMLRVMAAAAASETITDVGRLDDLRLAVDELAVAVIATAAPAGRLRVSLTVGPDRIRIRGEADADGVAPRLSEIGTVLVTSVTDSFDLDRNGSHVYFEAEVRPRG